MINYNSCNLVESSLHFQVGSKGLKVSGSTSRCAVSLSAEGLLLFKCGLCIRDRPIICTDFGGWVGGWV